MKTRNIGNDKFPIIEFIDEKILIKSTEDALNLFEVTEYTHIVLHDYNIDKDYFDLSTKKLGEILQKFSNYSIKMAIIGNFETYPSKVLKDFIFESNRAGDFLFVSDISDVLNKWFGKMI